MMPLLLIGAFALSTGGADGKSHVLLTSILKLTKSTNCFSDKFSPDATAPPVAGFRLDRKDQELGVDFSVDGPVPKNDFYRQFWDGRTKRAALRISTLKIDYADPKHKDMFSAVISVGPGEAVSPARVERALGIKLLPYRAERGWKDWYKGSDGRRFFTLSRIEQSDSTREWRIKCALSDELM